jgi:hypothetical protein
MPVDPDGGVPEEAPVGRHTGALAHQMMENVPCVQNNGKVISTGRLYRRHDDVAGLVLPGMAVQEVEALGVHQARVEIEMGAPPVGGAGVVSQLDPVVVAIEHPHQSVAVLVFDVELKAQ